MMRAIEPFRRTAPEPVAGSRDLALDFLRGLCLVVMIVDHIWFRTRLFLLTKNSIALSSAAEGFVLISGMVLGQVYRRRLDQHGLGTVTRQLWRRAGMIYLTHVGIMLFMLATELWGWVDWGYDFEAAVFAINPRAFVANVFLLYAQPAYMNILPMYVIFLLLAPGALWLLRRGHAHLLLGASLALWLLMNLFPRLWQVTQSGLNHAPFTPSTWQVFFVTGMVWGYHRQAIGEWTARHRRVYLPVVLAVFAFFFVLAHTLGRPGLEARGLYARWFDISLIGPGRFLNALVVFEVLYSGARHFWAWLQPLVGWLLLPLGQNSLLAFTLHVFVAYVTRTFPLFAWSVELLHPLDPGVLTLALLGLIWLTVKWVTKLSHGKTRSPLQLAPQGSRQP